MLPGAGNSAAAFLEAATSMGVECCPEAAAHTIARTAAKDARRAVVLVPPDMESPGAQAQTRPLYLRAT